MSPGRTYVAGLLALSVLAALAAFSQAGAQRPAIWLAVAVGVGIQGPLGWWLIRSVGTPRFLGVWVAGMLLRFAVLGVMALVVLPAIVAPITASLLALAIVLVVLLFFEGWMVWLTTKAGTS